MITATERKISFINVKMLTLDLRESENLARKLWEDGLGLAPNSTMEWTEEMEAELELMEERLKTGCPIQYVTGRTFFYNSYFHVDPRVLIPRSETEELVREVVSDFQRSDNILRVLDIGTGSGCIAISLKREFPDWLIHGIDISEDALVVARQNAEMLDVHIELDEKDMRVLTKNKNPQKWDIIVSNPPYIPQCERDIMDESVLYYEPEIALFTKDEDGLEFYRVLSKICSTVLNPEGVLYVELNENRVNSIIEIFLEVEGEMELIEDMQGKLRILKLRMKKDAE